MEDDLRAMEDDLRTREVSKFGWVKVCLLFKLEAYLTRYSHFVILKIWLNKPPI